MRYRISFEIDGAMLGTVIQVLTDKRVQNITTTPIEGSDSPADKPRTTRKASRRNSLTELALLEQMAPGESYSATQLGDMLSSRGLSQTSVSPTTSRLVRDGKIERLDGRKFRRNS